MIFQFECYPAPKGCYSYKEDLPDFEAACNEAMLWFDRSRNAPYDKVRFWLDEPNRLHRRVYSIHRYWEKQE